MVSLIGLILNTTVEKTFGLLVKNVPTCIFTAVSSQIILKGIFLSHKSKITNGRTQKQQNFES